MVVPPSPVQKSASVWLNAVYNLAPCEVCLCISMWSLSAFKYHCQFSTMGMSVLCLDVDMYNTYFCFYLGSVLYVHHIKVETG